MSSLDRWAPMLLKTLRGYTARQFFSDLVAG